MDFMFQNQECVSGCESGWTLYLEHSSISPYASYNQENEFLDGRKNELAKRLDHDDDEEEEEEEDLSMVSDASSGPPHLFEEDGYGGSNNTDTNGCFYHYPINYDDPLWKSSKKYSEKRRRNVQDQSSLLDDTASSPFFDFSDKSSTRTSSHENVVEYSQGYSSTKFEVRPPYEEQYDFFQSTQSGNQLLQNEWFEGKKW